MRCTKALYNKFANRGMDLECDINITNKYYLDNNIALIYKKPTPIKVSKVEYINNKKIIKEAFYEMPSTTDYNGIYKGKYIDFDAKEVKTLKSFNLSNLKKHQYEHINKVVEHGGISFLIVRFIKYNETYLIFTNTINEFIKSENKKSIPIEYFRENAYLIKESFIPRLNYLKIIDKVMEES